MSPAAAAPKRKLPAEQRLADAYRVMWDIGLRLDVSSHRLFLSLFNAAAAKILGGMTTGHFRQLVLELEAAGKIVKMQRGVWRVPRPPAPPRPLPPAA